MAKFSKGDKVIVVSEEVADNLGLGDLTGTVVGFGRKPGIIRVLLATKKQPQQFHEDFWERFA